MSGITSDVEEDDSIWKLSNARLPWLVIGIFGGLFGAFFLGSFENNYFDYHHETVLPHHKYHLNYL